MKSVNYDINISNHATQMFAFILEKPHRANSCLDKLGNTTPNSPSLKMTRNLPGIVKIYFLNYSTQAQNIFKILYYDIRLF